MGNITWLGADYVGVPFVSFPQTGGGTVTFYENGGGGGSSVQTASGTVSGSATNTLQIPCDFAPDLIYVYGDLSGSPSYRGIISVTLIKDTVALITNDGSTSNTNELLYGAVHGITGYGGASEPHATYANGVLTLDMVADSNATRFNSSVTYSYKFVKWT